MKVPVPPTQMVGKSRLADLPLDITGRMGGHAVDDRAASPGVIEAYAARGHPV